MQHCLYVNHSTQRAVSSLYHLIDLLFVPSIIIPHELYSYSEDMPQNKAETLVEDKKKLKPCCACPETKQARDAW